MVLSALLFYNKNYLMAIDLTEVSLLNHWYNFF